MGNDASALMTKHFQKLQDDDSYIASRGAQEDTMNKLFKLLDADSSGAIDSDEIPKLMEGIGKSFKKVTKTELDRNHIKMIIEEADANKDKEIDVNEFKHMMSKIDDIIRAKKQEKKMKK